MTGRYTTTGHLPAQLHLLNSPALGKTLKQGFYPHVASEPSLQTNIQETWAADSPLAFFLIAPLPPEKEKRINCAWLLEFSAPACDICHLRPRAAPGGLSVHRGIPPTELRACGGRVAFFGGARRLSSMRMLQCYLARLHRWGGWQQGGGTQAQGTWQGGVFGAGRDPQARLGRLQPSGATEGQGRKGCGGGSCRVPAPSRQPSKRQVSPRPTSAGTAAPAFRWRKAAPLRLRGGSPPSPYRDARKQPLSASGLPPARFPRTGGRGAAPGSDVTPRRRPRRLALQLLVPISAAARTNLISSRGIDGFVPQTLLLKVTSWEMELRYRVCQVGDTKTSIPRRHCGYPRFRLELCIMGFVVITGLGFSQRLVVISQN